jgi:hypothetical protein
MAKILVCSSEVRMIHYRICANAENQRRPYLYIYAHSNELEEVGIISLTGVKVEHNPDMEMLFGVSSRVFSCTTTTVLKAHPHSETIHLHTLYCFKLARVLSTK